MNAQDKKLVELAKRAGAEFAWRIVTEARAEKVQVSLAFALVEQESGFRNVYGHDGVRNPAPKGGKVTKANYLNVYLPARKRGEGMQGVGPMQLTWFEFQDQADKLGGCWLPSRNIKVGLRVVAQNIKQHGEFAGVAAYNGSGPAAQAYARSVLAKRDHWHQVLSK